MKAEVSILLPVAISLTLTVKKMVPDCLNVRWVNNETTRK